MFPGITGRAFANRLRSTARQFGRDKAARPGAHGIRGGASRAILETGGSSAQLLKEGQLHSSAYRLCLDLGEEETEGMASALIGTSEDGGDGIP